MRYMRFVRQIPAMLGGRIGRLSSLREEEALLRQFGAFPGARARSETRFWKPTTDRTHSALMFAARITLAHFSVSSAMSLPKSPGDPGSTVLPRSANRALILGSARPPFVSFFGLSMISAGVFLGAPMPSHTLASKPDRKSPTVGTSGSASERVAVVTRSAERRV